MAAGYSFFPQAEAPKSSNQFQHRHGQAYFNPNQRNHTRHERRGRADAGASETEIHLRDASRGCDGSPGELSEMRDETCTAEGRKIKTIREDRQSFDACHETRRARARGAWRAQDADVDAIVGEHC